MEGIEFTTEVIGDFEGEWGLPTLDTAWKLPENGGGRRLLGYKFYKKPVSSGWVTPFRSAQGLNGKTCSGSSQTRTGQWQRRRKLQRVGLHLKFSLVIWNSKIKISKILNSLNWVEFPNSEFQNLNQNSKMCIRIPKVEIPKFRIIKYEFSKSGIPKFR